MQIGGECYHTLKGIIIKKTPGKLSSQMASWGACSGRLGS